MLLLVTVLLVFAGLVLLVIGFVANSLAYIFVSIACAAVAAVALVVFSRLSRRRTLRLAAGGSGPGLSGESVGVGTGVGAEQLRGTDNAFRSPSGPEQRVGGADRTTTSMPVARGGAEQAAPGDEQDWDDEQDDWSDEGDWGDEVVFPIEDYDDLRVGEIVPLLPELDPDELQEVRDREEAGKARSTVLGRIDELLAGQAQQRSTVGDRGPFGEGSAAPQPDGSTPAGFPVKAKSASGLYHTPDSRYYSRTAPDVWFATEEHARAAGFTRWDERADGSAKRATTTAGGTRKRTAPRRTTGSPGASKSAAKSARPLGEAATAEPEPPSSDGVDDA